MASESFKVRPAMLSLKESTPHLDAVTIAKLQKSCPRSALPPVPIAYGMDVKSIRELVKGEVMNSFTLQRKRRSHYFELTNLTGMPGLVAFLNAIFDAEDDQIASVQKEQTKLPYNKVEEV
ncbi:uncharacterized protein SPSK_02838 [Sporothrix schenckii 1099-18]|uniref:Uncharacterized protein n=1 Tax=Sporothrix schenckii 1099-18 TaxID=1397361 RepID=A0A0F2M9Z4_SPOSC|nr:uncharacterized protein SPSK_02838 [Sporothrix schenckii 1099-18]KJR86508.1 hypothetical protein SPSK_02838 [Sporothrix schenckii 1099-18]